MRAEISKSYKAYENFKELLEKKGTASDLQSVLSEMKGISLVMQNNMNYLFSDSDHISKYLLEQYVGKDKPKEPSRLSWRLNDKAHKKEKEIEKVTVSIRTHIATVEKNLDEVSACLNALESINTIENDDRLRGFSTQRIYLRLKGVRNAIRLLNFSDEAVKKLEAKALVIEKVYLEKIANKVTEAESLLASLSQEAPNLAVSLQNLVALKSMATLFSEVSEKKHLLDRCSTHIQQLENSLRGQEASVSQSLIDQLKNIEQDNALSLIERVAQMDQCMGNFYAVYSEISPELSAQYSITNIKLMEQLENKLNQQGQDLFNQIQPEVFKASFSKILGEQVNPEALEAWKNFDNYMNQLANEVIVTVLNQKDIHVAALIHERWTKIAINLLSNGNIHAFMAIGMGLISPRLGVLIESRLTNDARKIQHILNTLVMPDPNHDKLKAMCHELIQTQKKGVIPLSHLDAALIPFKEKLNSMLETSTPEEIKKIAEAQINEIIDPFVRLRQAETQPKMAESEKLIFTATDDKTLNLAEDFFKFFATDDKALLTSKLKILDANITDQASRYAENIVKEAKHLNEVRQKNAASKVQKIEGQAVASNTANEKEKTMASSGESAEAIDSNALESEASFSRTIMPEQAEDTRHVNHSRQDTENTAEKQKPTSVQDESKVNSVIQKQNTASVMVAPEKVEMLRQLELKISGLGRFLPVIKERLQQKLKDKDASVLSGESQVDIPNEIDLSSFSLFDVLCKQNPPDIFNPLTQEDWAILQQEKPELNGITLEKANNDFYQYSRKELGLNNIDYPYLHGMLMQRHENREQNFINLVNGFSNWVEKLPVEKKSADAKEAVAALDLINDVDNLVSTKNFKLVEIIEKLIITKNTDAVDLLPMVTSQLDIVNKRYQRTKELVKTFDLFSSDEFRDWEVSAEKDLKDFQDAYRDIEKIIGLSFQDERAYKKKRAKAGGANDAGEFGGFYKDKLTKETILFKQDNSHAKNIVEFLVSRLNRALLSTDTELGDQSAEVILSSTQASPNPEGNGKDVYVGSIFSSKTAIGAEIKDFYRYAYEKEGVLPPKDRPKNFAGLAKDGIVQKHIKDFDGQIQPLIAVAWLLGNFDLHSANIAVQPMADASNRLLTYDFGAALDHLEKEIHPHSQSKHIPGFGPANQIVSNYPREIRISQAMADAIDQMTRKNLIDDIEQSMDEAAKFYGLEPLKAFAEHVGLTVSASLGENKKALLDGIKMHLRDLIVARQHSLEKFGFEIKLDLALDRALKEGATEFSLENLDAKKLVKEMKALIQENAKSEKYFKKLFSKGEYRFRGENHRGGFLDHHVTGETQQKLTEKVNKAFSDAFAEIEREKRNNLIVAPMASSFMPKLETILKKAKEIASQMEGADRYGIKTIILTKNAGALNEKNQAGTQKVLITEADDIVLGTNGETEIRFFEADAYHRIKIEDIIKRIHFLSDVAKTMLPSESWAEKSKVIEQVRQGYLEQAKKTLKDLNPETIRAIEAGNGAEKSPSFDAIYTTAKSLFSDMQRQLLLVINSTSLEGQKENFDFVSASKKFDMAAQEFLIKQGRPNIVHVMENGLVNAQFTKGDQTYPSSYRSSQVAGVNPNACFEVTAVQNGEGKLEASTMVSRAASYSVIGLKGKKDKFKRIQLNYLNAKKDMTEVVKAFVAANPNLDKSTIHSMNILSTSLLTPWLGKRSESLIARVLSTFGVAYKPETRQLKDHHRALSMLNGEQIEIDGVKVQLNIAHQNYPVNTNGRHWSQKLSELQSSMTSKGFALYAQQQQASLIESLKPFPRFVEMLRDFEPNFSRIEELKNQQKTLDDLYRDLNTLVGQKDGTIEAYRALDQEIRKLESEVSKKYEAIYAPIAKIWKDPEQLSKLKEIYEEIKKEITGVADPKQRVALQQMLYYLDVQKQYYRGEYKQPAQKYSFIAQLCRSADMANTALLINCKSTKDRSGWLNDYINVLFKLENDAERKFLPFSSIDPEARTALEENLVVVHEEGTGLQAIGENSPGARGNRINSYRDKSNLDRYVSLWQKMKATKEDPVKTLLKDARQVKTTSAYLALIEKLAVLNASDTTVKNPNFMEIRDTVSELFLKNVKKQIPDVFLGKGTAKEIDVFFKLLEVVEKEESTPKLSDGLKPYGALKVFAGVENEVLRNAIVKLLFSKIKLGLKLTATGNDLQAAIDKINTLMKSATDEKRGLAGYEHFLEAVSEIPELSDLKKAYNAADMLAHNEVVNNLLNEIAPLEEKTTSLEKQVRSQTNLIRQLTGIYSTEQKESFLKVNEQLDHLKSELSDKKEKLDKLQTALQDACFFIESSDITHPSNELKESFSRVSEKNIAVEKELAKVDKLSKFIRKTLIKELERKRIENADLSNVMGLSHNSDAQVSMTAKQSHKETFSLNAEMLRELKGIYVESNMHAEQFADRYKKISEEALDEIAPETLYFSVTEEKIEATISASSFKRSDASDTIKQLLSDMIDKSMRLYNVQDVSDLNIQSRDKRLLVIVEDIFQKRQNNTKEVSVHDGSSPNISSNIMGG